MIEEGARERITRVVTSWPGVQAETGSRGEFSFRFRGREIGHLHGHSVAHFSFPGEVGAMLREQGRVGPHPVAADAVKLGARRIRDAADEDDVVEMMRMNYERLMQRLGVEIDASGSSTE